MLSPLLPADHPPEAEGLVDVKTADWSNEVAPFWAEVIRSALTTRVSCWGGGHG
jgi:hypothetical protein